MLFAVENLNNAASAALLANAFSRQIELGDPRWDAAVEMSMRTMDRMPTDQLLAVGVASDVIVAVGALARFCRLNPTPVVQNRMRQRLAIICGGNA